MFDLKNASPPPTEDQVGGRDRAAVWFTLEG
jgi:hypothetical protein